jgi:hypothetical protein
MWVRPVVRTSEVKRVTWNTKILFTYHNALVTHYIGLYYVLEIKFRKTEDKYHHHHHHVTCRFLGLMTCSNPINSSEVLLGSSFTSFTKYME